MEFYFLDKYTSEIKYELMCFCLTRMCSILRITTHSGAFLVPRYYTHFTIIIYPHILGKLLNTWYGSVTTIVCACMCAYVHVHACACVIYNV